MMDNILSLPSRKVVEQEAVIWLIKMDCDQGLTADELTELHEWINRSPVHRSELIKLNSFWENNCLTELMVPLGRDGVEKADVDKTDINKKMSWQHAFYNKVVNFNSRLVIAIIIVATALFLWPFGIDNNSLLKSNGIYVTAVGQNKKITLADGSVVQLNTNSQIEVEYLDSYRNIRLLQGEAHFDVFKNEKKPFRVYAGDGRVEAVGTAFVVHLLKDNIDVMVTDGRVALASLHTQSNNTKNIIEDEYAKSRLKSLGTLDAGHRVKIEPTKLRSSSNHDHSDLKHVEVLSKDELARQQAWRKGMLVFTGESLEHVVAEISRYTSMSIEISDPEVKKIQIGGRFGVGNIDDMLDVLQENFGLQVVRLSYNKVRLSSSP